MVSSDLQQSTHIISSVFADCANVQKAYTQLEVSDTVIILTKILEMHQLLISIWRNNA